MTERRCGHKFLLAATCPVCAAALAGVVGKRCDYHYDPESGCDGVYDASGRCDQCGKPSIFEDYDPDSPLAASAASASGGRFPVAGVGEARPACEEKS